MDTYLQNGDMIPDGTGDMVRVTGLQEVIQRALLRLKLKRGSFIYNSELGSELHKLDIYKLDNPTILFAIRQALDSMDELDVIDVEKNLDYDNKILYLTVYLKINDEDAILEIKNQL